MLNSYSTPLNRIECKFLSKSDEVLILGPLLTKFFKMHDIMQVVFPCYLLVNSSYLAVFSSYLVVTYGYLIATTGGYFWLILVTLVTSCYFWYIFLVTKDNTPYIMNKSTSEVLTDKDGIQKAFYFVSKLTLIN